MQTNFSVEQLGHAATAESEKIIRKCVHCGFCTATCPTYLLLGDELDSPRGRIYLMKEMLEKQQTPTPRVVKHIDRCLSCLSCMTTCPSGVHYMHLVDHARAYIEDHYRRPWHQRLVRAALALVLPHPGRFRLALRLAGLARPLAGVIGRSKALQPIAAMLAIAPGRVAKGVRARGASTLGQRRGSVALLQGCAEPVLRPEIREATIRMLNRVGFDVLFAPGEGCCGALVHHMGREDQSLAAARRNVDAWWNLIERDAVAAILITASGCGTTIKDYGFMLRDDPRYAQKAERVSELARDVSEFLADVSLPHVDTKGLVVAYHPACSLQHGQRIVAAPVSLLEDAGFIVKTPAESHICCGSAGTYNILQPEIAAQLGERKAANLERLEPDLIATGNIGCAVQLARYVGTPIVHTIELLDWATGGPMPAACRGLATRAAVSRDRLETT